jgi:hypothetical protein
MGASPVLTSRHVIRGHRLQISYRSQQGRLSGSCSFGSTSSDASCMPSQGAHGLSHCRLAEHRRSQSNQSSLKGAGSLASRGVARTPDTFLLAPQPSTDALDWVSLVLHHRVTVGALPCAMSAPIAESIFIATMAHVLRRGATSKFEDDYSSSWVRGEKTDPLWSLLALLVLSALLASAAIVWA